MDNRRFQKHTAVYTCCECGKLTRDTGYGEGGTGLCKLCFQICEIENAVYDHNMTQEEADAEIAKIEVKQ